MEGAAWRSTYTSAVARRLSRTGAWSGVARRWRTSTKGPRLSGASVRIKAARSFGKGVTKDVKARIRSLCRVVGVGHAGELSDRSSALRRGRRCWQRAACRQQHCTVVATGGGRLGTALGRGAGPGTARWSSAWRGWTPTPARPRIGGVTASRVDGVRLARLLCRLAITRFAVPYAFSASVRSTALVRSKAHVAQSGLGTGGGSGRAWLVSVPPPGPTDRRRAAPPDTCFAGPTGAPEPGAGRGGLLGVSRPLPDGACRATRWSRAGCVSGRRCHSPIVRSDRLRPPRAALCFDPPPAGRARPAASLPPPPGSRSRSSSGAMPRPSLRQAAQAVHRAARVCWRRPPAVPRVAPSLAARPPPVTAAAAGVAHLGEREPGATRLRRRARPARRPRHGPCSEQQRPARSGPGVRAPTSHRAPLDAASASRGAHGDGRPGFATHPWRGRRLGHPRRRGACVARAAAMPGGPTPSPTPARLGGGGLHELCHGRRSPAGAGDRHDGCGGSWPQRGLPAQLRAWRRTRMVGVGGLGSGHRRPGALGMGRRGEPRRLGHHQRRRVAHSRPSAVRPRRGLAARRQGAAP